MTDVATVQRAMERTYLELNTNEFKPTGVSGVTVVTVVTNELQPTGVIVDAAAIAGCNRA